MSTCIHVSLSHTLCRTALVMLVKAILSYKNGFWICISSISRRFISIPLRSVRDSPPLIPSLTVCTSAYSDRLAVVSYWLSSPSKHPCFMSSCSLSRVHAYMYRMFLHSATRYIELCVVVLLTSTRQLSDIVKVFNFYFNHFKTMSSCSCVHVGSTFSTAFLLSLLTTSPLT